jgi:hypothetical protein
VQDLTSAVRASRMLAMSSHFHFVYVAGNSLYLAYSKQCVLWGLLYSVPGAAEWLCVKSNKMLQTPRDRKNVVLRFQLYWSLSCWWWLPGSLDPNTSGHGADPLSWTITLKLLYTQKSLCCLWYNPCCRPSDCSGLRSTPHKLHLITKLLAFYT